MKTEAEIRWMINWLLKEREQYRAKEAHRFDEMNGQIRILQWVLWGKTNVMG